MELTPGASKLAGYFGAIQSAAEQRLGVAGAWSALKDAVSQTGAEVSGVTIQDMNQMYSTAVGMREAKATLTSALETFNTASAETKALYGAQSITSDMVTQAPWSAPQDILNVAPEYRLNYQVEVTTPEGVQTTWRNVLFGFEPPSTVEEIQAALDAANAQLDYTYGQQTSSVLQASLIVQ